MSKISPILLQVFKNRFASIAEEMGVTLNRTAFSPNIKERRDFSCAIFDRSGDMIAQAAHIPVHLGSMPLSVKAAITAVPFVKGDMVMLNDPFCGGTHLPDITVVAPVFIDSAAPAYYVANRAHHADVGGLTPGSMPLAKTIHDEGVVIPPVKFVHAGEVDRSFLDELLLKVRTPHEREGDFNAQIMANLTGIRRCRELLEKYGDVQVDRYSSALVDYAERMMRSTIRAIPDGTYHYADHLDDDGFGTEGIVIDLKLEIRGDRAILDFSGSSAQVEGGVNAVYAITLSAALYVFRCLVEEDIPTNAGCQRPIQVLTRQGSVVDAAYPASVAAGNVETSQRVVDVILGALARAVPGKIPAASQGTMNNITIGGTDPVSGRPFAYYETLAGGSGASRHHAGASAVHSHMTNTLNTPVEALEYSYPFLVTAYAVRADSGGAGEHSGGDGMVRELELLADAEVTVLSERRTRAPYGLCGGAAGAPGRNTVVVDGRDITKPGKFTVKLAAGSRVRIETPGGGGFGKPEK
ncbi:MAG: 5-oxoprolinase [Desulfuromonas sp.]|nr:MAG: 5-oxoprolinase [Desulfuromonas sp.]